MAATNVPTNKIHVGENVRIISAITDANGAAVPFTDLLTVAGVAFDELGNEQTLVITADTITPSLTGLTYVVDTATMREGKIRSKLNLTFDSSVFPTSFARDIIEQELFVLEK